MSQVLRDARNYEEVHEKRITEEERPAFHLSARVGWMNDPNGFCFYNGYYHMFYQYHPYAPYWGPMHWGHAKSLDLLHWEYEPVALAPDRSYDRDGCFSGNAVELPDGKLLLMYTGVRKEMQEDGRDREVQTQCIAVGDGVNFEKYGENPVLDESDLPAGGSRFEFRDPKLWQRKDGSFRCIAGNMDENGSGRILLFGSEDGYHWSFLKVLAENRDRFGQMWECPDFFALDDKQVLFVSPQNMLPKGFEYHNGNGTVCLIGNYNEETETFEEETDQAVDYGIDFYAMQTVLTQDGRRVMIGWMQNWDTCELRTPHGKWQGQMSLPRELSIKNGRLYQQPIRELESFRTNRREYREVFLSGERDFPEIRGRKLELEIEIRPEDPQNIYHKFAVKFAQSEEYHTLVSYRPGENVLKIDRKFSGSRRAIIHQRRCKVIGKEDGCIRLRLILDRYSVEVFVNDGIQVMTAGFYTDMTADKISFLSDGKVQMNLVAYDLDV